MTETKPVSSSLDYRITHGRHDMVGISRVMHAQVYDAIDNIGSTLATVLIKGERGTGKELVARAIYKLSPRSGMPLVIANCAAIPSELLESELFGHTWDAYTGSKRERAGLFGAANQGTLFLDEIAEMTPTLQAKILRAVEYGDVRKVGSDFAREVYVRFIASTNRDLLRAKREGAFREDLYDRLATVTITVPPLRERREDIPYLIRHLMQQMQKLHGREAIPFTPEEYGAYQNYEWLGNVRELGNAIARVILRRADKMAILEEIKAEDGYFNGQIAVQQSAASQFTVSQKPLSLAEVLAEAEKVHLLNVLKRVGFNKSKAAQLLGINREKIRRRLKDFSVDDFAMGREAVIEILRRTGDISLAAKEMDTQVGYLNRAINYYGIKPQELE